MRTVSTAEYAKLAGLSASQVRKRIKAGTIPAVKGKRGYQITTYTTKEYADIIGVTPATIRKWLKTGKVEGVTTGKTHLFTFKQPERKPEPEPDESEPEQEECESIYSYPVKGRRKPKGTKSREEIEDYVKDISPLLYHIFKGCETGRWHVYIYPSDPVVAKK